MSGVDSSEDSGVVEYPSRSGSPAPQNTPTTNIRVLLLEKIHSNAKEIFTAAGYTVDEVPRAMGEDELIKTLENNDYKMIGIRSKTVITARVLQSKHSLWAIGCFCIGTNQVDLEAAAEIGVPVFNSPFCNSRSVAELIIAEIVCLYRKLGDAVRSMHSGVWNKSSAGCREVRGKVLGIVGYGHIGSQLSVLAEAMGMRVIFYDVIRIMPIGNSQPVASLEDLLSQSDIVTLHVPDTPQTRNMITKNELNLMKNGSFFLNASRGTVVDLDALAEALNSKHIAGAAIDVYPEEPFESLKKDWVNVLQNCPNTILTPHIGGSTEEAQASIGAEVADVLTKFVGKAKTEGCVNMPQVSLPSENERESHRIVHIHKNVPGVMKQINSAVSDFNILGQALRTRGSIGYLVMDVDQKASDDVAMAISSIPATIRCRVLY